MNNTWVTSDTHFYHNNIIKYCNRPFTSAEEMNEQLIKNWNSVVGKDDLVYHLGDFALCNKKLISEIVQKLNGRICLIMGNHDHENVKDYYSAGFYRVYDRPIIVQDFIILSHAPIFVTENMPYINIFGHVHDALNYNTVSKCGACVCCERWDYRPTLLENLVDEIKHLIVGENKDYEKTI